jgi:hypothetical protein
MKICVILCCLAKCHERFRKICPFQHARLYLERLGKAEMALKSIAIVVVQMPQIGRRPNIYAKAVDRGWASAPCGVPGRAG